MPEDAEGALLLQKGTFCVRIAIVRTEDRKWLTQVDEHEPYAGDPALSQRKSGRTLLYFVRTNNRMAISKDKKREIVAKLTDALKEASSIAFVGFSKLTVKDASKLRAELSQKDVKYYVAKKTLLRRVLEAQGYEGTMPELPGEVAVAWTNGDEVTAPARGVYEFGKKMKGALALLGGVFEGAFLDAKNMTAIATIPPMPVLRGMFANIINSPIQRFAISLAEVVKTKN